MLPDNPRLAAQRLQAFREAAIGMPVGAVASIAILIQEPNWFTIALAVTVTACAVWSVRLYRHTKKEAGL